MYSDQIRIQRPLRNFFEQLNEHQQACFDPAVPRRLVSEIGLVSEHTEPCGTTCVVRNINGPLAAIALSPEAEFAYNMSIQACWRGFVMYVH
jgi:hypothetical protein